MAITVTHAKNVAIADDPKAAAAGEVLPSDWNAVHTVSGIREPLSANTNFYVSATGSNSNDGLTSGTAWATLQHAMDHINSSVDTAGFSVIVNIGAGSFAGVGLKQVPGGGPLEFRGAGTASTTITNGPNDGVFNFGEPFGAYIPTYSTYYINQLTIAPATPQAENSTIAIVVNGSQTTIVLANPVDSNVNGALAMTAPASSTGYFFVGLYGPNTNFTDSLTGDTNPPITLTGSCAGFLYAELLALVVLQGNYTISGSPTYDRSFFVQNYTSQIDVPQGSYTGACTGLTATLAQNSNLSYAVTLPGSGIVADSSSSVNTQAGSDVTYPQPTTPLRISLTGNTSFYVATTGSDSNEGSSSKPWATLQHAMDFISAHLDLAGYTATVNVGSGTFSGFGVKSCIGGGIIDFLGAGSTSTSTGTIVSNGPNDGTYNFGECISSYINLETVIAFTKMKFSPTTGTNILNITGICTFSPGGTPADVGDITFDLDNTKGHIVGEFGFGAELLFQSNGSGPYNYTLNYVNAPASHTFIAFDNSTIFPWGTFTIVGNPAFTSSASFIELINSCSFDNGLFGGASFSGASTGVSGLIQAGSALTTGGVTFPGSTGFIVDASSSVDGETGEDIPIPFASLPTAVKGMIRTINDGKAANCGDAACTTFGTHVTGGGGALNLKIWYNGTNWTLIGI